MFFNAEKQRRREAEILLVWGKAPVYTTSATLLLCVKTDPPLTYLFFARAGLTGVDFTSSTILAVTSGLAFR